MSLWACLECGTRYSVDAPACPQCQSTERATDGDGPVQPHMTVYCAADVCPQAGIQRRVQLRLAALNVFELPTLVCAACGCHVASVLPTVEKQEEDMPKIEEDMPKITVHGGPSNEADQVEPEEDECPGTGSSPSSEKTSPSETTTDPDPQQPAPTTASRSKKGRTAGSSARSTDGGQTDDASASE